MVTESMQISDSLTIETHYRPAWSYATSAVTWLERSSEIGSPPNHFGSEHCFLALLFSCLCLEAIIAEFLTDESSQNNDDLFNARIPISQRWKEGVPRIGTGSASSQSAIATIIELCQDKKPYGLLVRSRNKLIHPQAYTEVMDDFGHQILDKKIGDLVADLKAANLGLPDTTPAFPHIIKCRPGAVWATGLMKEMLVLIHAVREKHIDEKWNDVLQRI